MSSVTDDVSKYCETINSTPKLFVVVDAFPSLLAIPNTLTVVDVVLTNFKVSVLPECVTEYVFLLADPSAGRALYTLINGVAPSKPIVICELYTLVPSPVAKNISAPRKLSVFNSNSVCPVEPSAVTKLVSALTSVASPRGDVAGVNDLVNDSWVVLYGDFADVSDDRIAILCAFNLLLLSDPVAVTVTTPALIDAL